MINEIEARFILRCLQNYRHMMMSDLGESRTDIPAFADLNKIIGKFESFEPPKVYGMFVDETDYAGNGR